jgi:hypothetical protein
MSLRLVAFVITAAVLLVWIEYTVASLVAHQPAGVQVHPTFDSVLSHKKVDVSINQADFGPDSRICVISNNHDRCVTIAEFITWVDAK